MPDKMPDKLEVRTSRRTRAALKATGLLLDRVGAIAVHVDDQDLVEALGKLHEARQALQRAERNLSRRAIGGVQ